MHIRWIFRAICLSFPSAWLVSSDEDVAKFLIDIIIPRASFDRLDVPLLAEMGIAHLPVNGTSSVQGR